MTSERDDILQVLYSVIESRKGASPDSSYTASLMHKGIDKILKKLGEEATELVIAGKGGVRDETVYEAADLFYHTLVLLAYRDIPLDAVLDELRRRFGTSGHAEKAARQE
jgi:phosphoribosyl-ATP pyrophosphohydrolase